MFSFFLLLYTLPYISIQISAAGSILQLIGGFNKSFGAFIITTIIVIYTFRGGIKSIIKTDILQLFILYFFAISAIIIVGLSLKENNFINKIFFEVNRIHKRLGINGKYDLSVIIGFYVLWFMADPMFPQLTQRFYASRSDKSLIFSMTMYPLASFLIFFIMCFYGVIGNIIMPGLNDFQSKNIFTLILQKFMGNFASIFSLSALAALMSTMDSQLLTSSSIISKDFFNDSKSIFTIRLIIVAVAFLSFVISLYLKSTILSFLKKGSFNGYATLFLPFLCAIYFPEVNKKGIIVSILTGNVIVFSSLLKLINYRFAVVFYILGVQILIFIVFYVIDWIKRSYIKNKNEKYNIEVKIKPYKNGYLNLKTGIIALIIFILGTGFWDYKMKVVLFFGFPFWVWEQLIVSIIMTIFFYSIYEKTKNRNNI